MERSSMKIASIVTIALVSAVSAFVQPHVNCRVGTHLFLENHIAEMIDKEVDRLKNIGVIRRKEHEKRKEWNEKEPSFPEGFDFNSVNEYQPNNDAAKKIQLRKDKRMAREDPARYCADRCVSTGNCQVWEDMFDLSAEEVQKFCTECVLSEGEEPCDVPEKFLENAGKPAWEVTKMRP